MKLVLTYIVALPFMLVGVVACVAVSGYRAGWAWAEYFGEKYL